MAAFEGHVQRLYVEAHGQPIIGEVKSSILYKLRPADIEFLGEKLAWFLDKNDAALFAFFTDVQALVKNRMRDAFHADPLGLRAGDPAQFAKFYASLRSKTQTEPHNLGELRELYSTFIGFCGQHHGHLLGQTFGIQYDPRHVEENSLLHAAGKAFLQLTERVSPGACRFYTGADSSIPSAHSPGLKLVDFIVGDVRRLFRKVPSLRTEESRLEVLTARSDGIRWYDNGLVWGFQRRISESTWHKAISRSNGLLFPFIYQRFACRIITCHALEGEARHVLLQSRRYLDMVD